MLSRGQHKYFACEAASHMTSPCSRISIFSSVFLIFGLIVAHRLLLETGTYKRLASALGLVRVCSQRFVVARWPLGLLQLLQRLNIQSILPSLFVSILGLFLQNVGLCPWIVRRPLDCSSTINLLRYALVRRRLDKYA